MDNIYKKITQISMIKSQINKYKILQNLNQLKSVFINCEVQKMIHWVADFCNVGYNAHKIR